MSPEDKAHRAMTEVSMRFAPHISSGYRHFVMHPHTWAEIRKNNRGTPDYHLWGLPVALDTRYAVGEVSCEFRFEAVVK